MAEVTPVPRATGVLMTAAAFVIVVAGMRAAEAIIIPFLLSIFLARKKETNMITTPDSAVRNAAKFIVLNP